MFDFTAVNCLNSAGAIAANAACTFQAGNSNIYTVATGYRTTNRWTSPCVAVNDRGGALAASGAYQWMTTQD